jgi:hypothetical protein
MESRPRYNEVAGCLLLQSGTPYGRTVPAWKRDACPRRM